MSGKSYDGQFASRLNVLVEMRTCFLCVVCCAYIEIVFSLCMYEHNMLKRIYTQWLN